MNCNTKWHLGDGSVAVIRLTNALTVFIDEGRNWAWESLRL